MDLIDYSEKFYDIVYDFRNFSSKLEIPDIDFIPISILMGIILQAIQRRQMYQGSSLLYSLENLHISSDNNYIDSRFTKTSYVL